CADHGARTLHVLATDGGDRHRTVVVHADLGAGLLLDPADRLALGPDEIADLVGRDLHGDDTWSILRHVLTRRGESFLHLGQDVQTTGPSLRHRLLHDLEVEPLDLDVHLDGGDTVGGSGNLEVHVAEV